MRVSLGCVVVSLLMVPWSAGCSTEKAPSPAAAPSTAEPTCEQWSQFTFDDQAAGMQSLLEKSLPPALPQNTRECLFEMPDKIALHATELCQRDGGAFKPAAATAITTAIQYCQTRS